MVTRDPLDEAFDELDKDANSSHDDSIPAIEHNDNDYAIPFKQPHGHYTHGHYTHGDYTHVQTLPRRLLEVKEDGVRTASSADNVTDVKPPEVVPPSRFSMPADSAQHVYETVEEPRPLQVSREYEPVEPRPLEEPHPLEEPRPLEESPSMPHIVPIYNADWKNIDNKDKLQVHSYDVTLRIT